MILDAAILGGGGVLVALGAAGLWQLSRDGASRRIEVPAERLVVSDDGRRAIAMHVARWDLGVRDWELALIDLESGKPQTRWHMMLSSFPGTYDGRRWFVVTDRPALLVALEFTEDGPPRTVVEAEDPGWMDSMRRRGDVLHIETSSLGACHYAQHQLPGLKILDSGNIPDLGVRFPPEMIVGHMIPPISDEPVALLQGFDHTLARFTLEGGEVSIPLHQEVPFQGTHRFDALGKWAAGRAAYSDGVSAAVLDIGRRRLLPRLHLPGRRQGGVKLENDLLLAWENGGHLGLVDLHRECVLMSVRVREDGVAAVPPIIMP